MIHFDLPGAELLEAGLTDLAQNKLSPAALAVCALRPRLNAIGVGVLELHLSDDAEILMYQALGRAGEPKSAHGDERDVAPSGLVCVGG